MERGICLSLVVLAVIQLVAQMNRITKQSRVTSWGYPE